jgi:Leucine-rich repeat (LRR) protein
MDFKGNRFYIQIESIGVFGEKTQIWLESDSNIKYFDLQKNKIPSLKDIIRMDVVKKDKTRKQERESKFKYPMTLSYEITPCKYDTIEFLKAMVEILISFNDQIKNKED